MTGVIATEGNETVQGVEVNVNNAMSMTTSSDGTYHFDNLPLGGDYTVTPYLNANPLNGVTTFDIILISKHILGVQALDSPYKRIAADANRSNTITTLDLIHIRKLILNITTEFSNNTSWRFVETAYAFPDATNPWFETFPELINENNLSADVLDADFVGVKIGDVNASAQANLLSSDDRTLNGLFNFETENIELKAGNTYTIPFTGADMASVEGYQATLALQGVELVDIQYGIAQAANFGLRYAEQGMITTSWNRRDAMHRVSTDRVSTNTILFSLIIEVTEDAMLNEVISISSRYTQAEAYVDGNTTDVGIQFTNGAGQSDVFALYQNIPNPFVDKTMISFSIPTDSEVTITLRDVRGRLLNTIKGDYAAGVNNVQLTKRMLNGITGVVSYTVTAVSLGSAEGEHTATRKMVVVE